MLRDVFKTVRDIVVLALLTYLILTPEVFGRWKANAEMSFYKEAGRIGLWTE